MRGTGRASSRPGVDGLAPWVTSCLARMLVAPVAAARRGAAPSRSPTAASTCCTSATSATSQARRAGSRPADRRDQRRRLGAGAEGRRAARFWPQRIVRSSWRRCAASTTWSIFPEPTVGPLLEALRPDVHCKGTDYTFDTVPERDDRQRLRRPDRDRRRSEGSFHARPAGANCRLGPVNHRFLLIPPRARWATSSMRFPRRRRCARAFPRRGSTGWSIRATSRCCRWSRGSTAALT